MKTFIQKVLVVMLATFIMSLLVKGIIQVGDTYIYENDIQILYDLDYPQTQLNNHTLREVFEGANLVVNGYLKNGLNNFLGLGGNLSIVDGYINIAGDGSLANLIIKTTNKLPTVINNVYYIRSKIRTLDSVTNKFDIGSVSYNLSYISYNNPTQNEWIEISAKRVATSTLHDHYNVSRYIDSVTQNGKTLQVAYTINIDQTSLGISSLTVSQMDYWFNIYQTLKELEV